MNTIFALDASGQTAGVCVMQAGRMLFEQTLCEGLTHSETLLALAQRAFEQTGTSPATVSTYAVTIGPGSFTGLRIGLALVKGLALPYETPVSPVSTLKALATGCGHTGRVLCALNARRGEVYWAAFDCTEDVCRLTPDAAGPVADIEATGFLSKGPVYLVGDGAEICYNAFMHRHDVEYANEGPWAIAKGAALCALRSIAPLVSAADVHPSYLRESQAQRERALRLASATAEP